MGFFEDSSHLYTDYFKRAMIIIYDLSNLFIRVSNKRKVSGIHLTHRVPWFAPLPPPKYLGAIQILNSRFEYLQSQRPPRGKSIFLFFTELS